MSIPAMAGVSDIEIGVKLDFGDIGEVAAVVGGTVSESGLFGPGRGFLNSKVLYVVVSLPGREKGSIVFCDVTHLIGKSTLADLEEELEYHYGLRRK